MSGAWGTDANNYIVRWWRNAPSADGEMSEGLTVRIPPDGENAIQRDVGKRFDGTRAGEVLPSDELLIKRARRRAAIAIEEYDRIWYPRVTAWHRQSGGTDGSSGTQTAGSDTLIWMTSIFVAASEGLLDSTVTAEQTNTWAEFIEELDNAKTVGDLVNEPPVQAWYLRYFGLPSGTDGTRLATAARWRAWWDIDWCPVYLPKFINNLPGVIGATATAPAYLTITVSNWKNSNWLELRNSLLND